MSTSTNEMFYVFFVFSSIFSFFTQIDYFTNFIILILYFYDLCDVHAV
jgi:hypothetical protein